MSRIKATKSWRDMLAEDLKDPEFRREYEAVQSEFAELDKILAARAEAGMTQADIAEKMGTSQSAVARLEARLMKGDSPSMNSLKRYAAALGKKVEVRFV